MHFVDSLFQVSELLIDGNITVAVPSASTTWRGGLCGGLRVPHLLFLGARQGIQVVRGELEFIVIHSVQVHTHFGYL